MTLDLKYQDTFSIPSSNGWGYTEVPYTPSPWDSTLFGGSTAKANGVGTIVVTTGASSAHGNTIELGNINGRVLARGTLDVVPPGAGAIVFLYVFFRIQDASNYYKAGFYVTNAGAVKTRVQKVVNGTATTISGADATITASGWASGDRYWADVVWSGPHIQLTSWKDGNAEPGTPTVDIPSDTTFPGGTKVALITNGNGANLTGPVTGEWSYFQGYIADVTYWTQPSPTLWTLDPAKTMLGIHPDGLTKFWNADFIGAGFGSEPLNAALLQRESALDRKLDMVGAYVEWGEWTGEADPNVADPSLSPWPGNIQKNLRNITKGGRNLMLSFFAVATAPADWREGTVAGLYDSVYTSLADELVGQNPYDGQILMRLNWEMNLSGGGGGAWATNPTGFIAYWQYVVTLMRTRDPSNLLKWFWCPSGSGSTLWTDFYPGDAYVDVLGFDKYNGNPFADAATLWTQHSSSNPGNVDFYNTFLSHGKVYSQGETGTRVRSDATLPSAQPTTAAQWTININGTTATLPNRRCIMFWDKQIGQPLNQTQPDYHLDTVEGPHPYPGNDVASYSTVNNPHWDAVHALFNAAEFNGLDVASPAVIAFHPVTFGKDMVAVQ